MFKQEKIDKIGKISKMAKPGASKSSKGDKAVVKATGEDAPGPDATAIEQFLRAPRSAKVLRPCPYRVCIEAVVKVHVI